MGKIADALIFISLAPLVLGAIALVYIYMKLVGHEPRFMEDWEQDEFWKKHQHNRELIIK